jgi:hypothetical protein
MNANIFSINGTRGNNEVGSTFITVTSVSGQPSFTLPGRATTRDIAVAVKARYGKHVVHSCGVSAAMPHNFSARFEGPQSDVSAAGEVEVSRYALAQLALNLRSPGSRRWASC